METLELGSGALMDRQASSYEIPSPRKFKASSTVLGPVISVPTGMLSKNMKHWTDPFAP